MAGRIVTNEKGPLKMPIIGKIKVGKKNEYEPGKFVPQSLDYFIATGQYADRFHKTFGDKPQSVGIIFMSDDITQSCNERFELRDKKTGNLIGDGDGVNFKLWDYDKKELYDYRAHDDESKKILAEYTKKHSNGEVWRAILTIECIIPKISSVMGLWRFETKGVLSTIPNIRDTFDTVKEFAGTVVNIPFDLQVKKVGSQRPGDRRSYSVVSLIPNVEKDRLDDVRSFIDQGNKIRDIKGFLEGSKVPDEGKIKQLEENSGKVKHLTEGKTIQAALFTGNT